MEKIPLSDAIQRMKCGVRKTVLPDAENAVLYEKSYAIYHRLYDFFGRENPDLMAQLRTR